MTDRETPNLNSSTAYYSQSGMDKSSSVSLCLISLSLIIATTALVLSIVVLTRPNVLTRGNVGAAQRELDQVHSDTIPQKNAESAVPQGTPNQDEKVYVFAYDVPWEEYQFVTVDGHLKGLSVDVVSSVCQEAGKTCRHIVVPIQDCWDSVMGRGVGLLDRWFDACAVFLKTAIRTNIFGYSGSFYKQKRGQFYTKSSKQLSTSSPDNLTIGVRSHWYVSDNCLIKHGKSVGTVLKAKDYDTLYQLISNDTVDAVFAEEETFDDKSELISHHELFECGLGGSGVMHRVDSDIPTWFEPAFERIKRSGKFLDMCDKYVTVRDNCLRD